MSDRSPVRYDLAMLLVSLIWGINFSVTKFALGAIPVFAFAGLRFLGATTLLWLAVRLTESAPGPPIPRAVLGRLFLLGVAGNTLYQMAFLFGLARTTATNSALIIAFIPVMVAVLGSLTGVELATRGVKLALGLGTLGVILVIADRGPARLSGDTLLGDAVTLGAVVLWAGYTLGIRRSGQGISPLRLTLITTAAGTPGLLLAGLPSFLSHDWGSVPPAAWGALFYASAASIVVAYLIWNLSVQAIGTNRTSLYACVTPVFAAAGAWVVLGERFSALQLAGGVLVLASVLVARR